MRSLSDSIPASNGSSAIRSSGLSPWASSESRKKAVLPPGCTALLAATPSQRSEDFAILPFGKGFHGLGGHVAQRSRGQHEFRAGLIIGKFRDDHRVVLSHGQVPGMNLSSRFLCSLLGSLLGVADQRNEVRHTAFLLIETET